jgi:aspartate carbamoyltransferase catalytic subunit
VLGSILAGKTSANLFYENSTRTRLSFELASKHLGMHVLNLDVSRSSVQKGESLEDTARTLAAMGVNVIVQRHSTSGSAAKIAEATNDKVHVINAGEGTTDHPTQALLDLFTMLEVSAEQKDLTDKKIVIVGDILHSRVASANLSLLPLFGAKIHLVGPAQLLPQNANAKDVMHQDLDEALIDADFVMAIRPQFERQESGIFGSIDKYISSFQINHERLKKAKRSVKIYAPGPINRDVEISGKLADDRDFSLIEKQVQNGVPMRMAVIEALCADD